MHDALGNREAKARPVFLRREKRLEQPPQVFRRDAHAGVADLNLQLPAVTSVSVLDRQRAVRPHRLDRVEQKIHERLLQLKFVPAHRVRRGLVIALERNQFAADLVLDQPQRMVEQIVDAHGRECRACPARRTAASGSTSDRSAQFAPDDLGQFRVLAFLQQQFDERLDGGQCRF